MFFYRKFSSTARLLQICSLIVFTSRYYITQRKGSCIAHTGIPHKSDFRKPDKTFTFISSKSLLLKKSLRNSKTTKIKCIKAMNYVTSFHSMQHKHLRHVYFLLISAHVKLSLNNQLNNLCYFQIFYTAPAFNIAHGCGLSIVNSCQRRSR